MIPDPPFQIIIIIIPIVLGLLFGGFFISIKKDSVIHFIVLSVFGLCIFVIGMYQDNLVMNEYNELVDEHNEQLQIIINNADCDVLPEIYQAQYYELFKEKIKSKYIFDCVAEKEQLEMFR